MFTLNKLISTIATYSTAHKQIKSWYFGDPWDQLNGGQSIKYPMLFGTLQPNRVEGTSDITVIRFYICDKSKKGLRNQLEVLSDCKQIALDTLIYFKQFDFSELIDVNENATLTDFVDAFNDEVAGWYFDVEFKSIFEWDACSLPITGSPAIINPDDVRIIDQDGNVIAVVPCGSYYTIEVLQQLIQTLTDPAPVTIIQTLT